MKNDELKKSAEFLMYHFKVDTCSDMSHDYYVCPFTHVGETLRRRDLNQHSYSSIRCKNFKEKGPKSAGDSCPNAHGTFEVCLHPDNFRTRRCLYGSKCKRDVCFFSHNDEEDRSLPVQQQQFLNNEANNSVPGSSS